MPTRSIAIAADVEDPTPAIEVTISVLVPEGDTKVEKQFTLHGVPRSAVTRGAVRDCEDDEDLFYLVIREVDHDDLQTVLDNMTLAQTVKLTEFISEAYLKGPGKRPKR